MEVDVARKKAKRSSIETIYSGDRVSLRANLLRSGKRSLFLAINPPGARENKRIFRTLRLYLTGDRESDRETLELAKQIVRETEADLFQNPEVVVRRNRHQSFLEFVQALGKEKDGRGHSWRSLVYHLRAFAEGNDITFAHITTLWAKDFRGFLLSRVSQSSAALYFSNFLTAIKIAVQERMLDFDPTLNVPRIKKKQSAREYLTIDELRAMLETPCRRDDVRRAFLFACYTGLRLSDVKALRWSMVQDRTLSITMVKNRTPLTLPLNDTALSLMGERTSSDSHIFTLPAESTINEVLAHWSSDAGVEKHVTFHVSRHTFATLLITAGADVYTVSKLLGHADVKVTQIYAKMVDQRKRDAVDLIPDLQLR